MLERDREREREIVVSSSIIHSWICRSRKETGMSVTDCHLSFLFKKWSSSIKIQLLSHTLAIIPGKIKSYHFSLLHPSKKWTQISPFLSWFQGLDLGLPNHTHHCVAGIYAKALQRKGFCITWTLSQTSKQTTFFLNTATYWILLFLKLSVSCNSCVWLGKQSQHLWAQT